MSTDEKPTVEFSRPPDWAIALTEKVTRGFEKMNANLELVSSDLDVLKGRVGNLEESRRADESRAALHSIKVKSISQSDLSQDAELAKEKSAREELAARVAIIESNVGDIHQAVVGFFQNPKVRFVGRLLWGAALLYAAGKGLKVLP